MKVGDSGSLVATKADRYDMLAAKNWENILERLIPSKFTPG